MFKIIEVPLEEDLGQFSRLLWQHKISHRIFEQENSQVLAVSGREHVQTAAALYGQWYRGEIRPLEQDSSDISVYFSAGKGLESVSRAFRRAPLSLLLVLVCIVLAFVAPLDGMNEIARSMLYPDFSYGTRIINLDRVLESFTVITFFKMLSPILLHGGLVHLAFNMLWLWEFGRRIEAVQASWAMLLLIVVLALFSNTVQYLYSGSIYFGGMSGVVYGLFAYIWMWQLFDPTKNLSLPGALVFFLLLSLIIMTAIDLDFIADEAHVGGFLAGMVYGAATATVSRIRRRK